MTRAELVQLAGIVQLVAAMSWLIGPVFLFVMGAVFLVLPEIVLARATRERAER